MEALVLVSGPNGSGKSRWAEGLAARCPGPRYYIATMIPETEENRERIQRHRLQRTGLGFETLELPCGLDAVPASGTALLEDVSNLLGNALFRYGAAAEAVLEEILDLAGRCRLLIAVTISGLSPAGYTGETAAYIRHLNRLNAALFRAAAAAVELRGGVPVPCKGEPDEIPERVFGGAVHLQRDSHPPLPVE